MHVSMILYQLNPSFPMARAALCVSSPNIIPPNGVMIRSWTLGCSRPPSQTYSHRSDCVKAKKGWLPDGSSLWSCRIVIKASLVGMSNVIDNKQVIVFYRRCGESRPVLLFHFGRFEHFFSVPLAYRFRIYCACIGNTKNRITMNKKSLLKSLSKADGLFQR